MASEERELIMRVWRHCSLWGPGVKPLVRGSGGEAPEDERIFYNKWLSFVIQIKRISSFYTNS